MRVLGTILLVVLFLIGPKLGGLVPIGCLAGMVAIWWAPVLDAWKQANSTPKS